jgi:hypothetical protein
LVDYCLFLIIIIMVAKFTVCFPNFLMIILLFYYFCWFCIQEDVSNFLWSLEFNKRVESWELAHIAQYILLWSLSSVWSSNLFFLILFHLWSSLKKIIGLQKMSVYFWKNLQKCLPQAKIVVCDSWNGTIKVQSKIDINEGFFIKF